MKIKPKTIRQRKGAKVQSKALLKRWVFRPRLKASTAAEQNARSPIVWSFVLGGFRRYAEANWI